MITTIDDGERRVVFKRKTGGSLDGRQCPYFNADNATRCQLGEGHDGSHLMRRGGPTEALLNYLDTEIKAMRAPSLAGPDFQRVGSELGALCAEKNAAYGDSFAKTGEFLKLLFPDGIPVDKYQDALAIVRIYDKLMRIATNPDAFAEDPWADIAGYAILSVGIKRAQQ